MAEHAYWQPGDWVILELPDGRRIRCRVVNILENGTVQIVPEDGSIIVS